MKITLTLNIPDKSLEAMCKEDGMTREQFLVHLKEALDTTDLCPDATATVAVEETP